MVSKTISLDSKAKNFAKALLRKVSARNTLKHWGLNAARRTERLKKILRSLAKEDRFKVNPQVRKHREFLCDFSCVRYVRYHRTQLEEFSLFAECEWSTNPKSVVYDFRKLIPLKSPWKLCVYQVKGSQPEGPAEELRDRIATTLKSYKDHRKGETYFLLEMRRHGEKECQPKLWYWRVPEDGHKVKPRFAEWP